MPGTTNITDEPPGDPRHAGRTAVARAAAAALEVRLNAAADELTARDDLSRTTTPPTVAPSPMREWPVRITVGDLGMYEVGTVWVDTVEAGRAEVAKLFRAVADVMDGGEDR